MTTNPRERAAIHPVATSVELKTWLVRVPLTRTFPSDLDGTLQAHAADLTIEMTTAPGCLPCDDLWTRLLRFSRAYGWRVRIVSGDEALLRSGRLGLPWVGHPVLWVRPTRDERRTIPVAIGTDHDVNLRRNIYLAAKMFDGVRPAVALRAMSKFTGIVAPGGARTIISKSEGH
ncbi:MAG: hypothetical protein C0494_17515 [Sphingobium sp.]|nr:hypothetical protein [Sphingobium sp.]